MHKRIVLPVLAILLAVLFVVQSQTVFAKPTGVELNWVNATTIEVVSVTDPGGTSIGTGSDVHNVDFSRVYGTYSRDNNNDAFKNYLGTKGLWNDFRDKFNVDNLSGGASFSRSDSGCLSIIYASKENAYVVLDPRVPSAGNCVLARLDRGNFVNNFIVYTTDISGAETANTKFVRNTEDNVITTPFLPGVKFVYSGTPNIYLREDEDGQECQDRIVVSGSTAKLTEQAKNPAGCVLVGSGEQTGELVDVANAEEAAALDGSASAEGGAQGDATCESKGGPFGWVLCEIFKGVIGALDKFSEFVQDRLDVNLKEEAALRSAWDSIKTIANILFVIAFLFIIISQTLVGRF